MYLQNIIFLLSGLAIPSFAGLLFYYKRKSKPSKKLLKKGDYVMLKKSFKHEYPGVPTNYPLTIDELTLEEATVIYMDLKNQILKKTIRLKALTLAV